MSILRTINHRAAKRGHEFEALISDFSGIGFQHDIHTSAPSCLIDLCNPVLLYVIDGKIRTQALHEIQLFLRACQSDNLLYTHGFR